MLIEGVKLFHYNKNFQNVVFLSQGTELAKGKNKGIPYAENSFRPSKPWRKVDDLEKDKLIMDAPNKDFRKQIGIIKVSDKVQNAFEKLSFNLSESYESIQFIKKNRNKLYNNALEILSDDISNYLFDDSNIDVLGLNIGRSNIELVTLGKDGKHTGLHVDSWDGHLSIDDIDSMSTNRISINLGRNDRYFLFVNLTLRQIYQSLEIENKKEFNEYTKMELSQIFFNTKKQYPVLKVKISPYEAYIAPTENIIHDGSTEGSDATDISFTVRGNFNIFNRQEQI